MGAEVTPQPSQSCDATAAFRLILRGAFIGSFRSIGVQRKTSQLDCAKWLLEALDFEERRSFNGSYNSNVPSTYAGFGWQGFQYTSCCSVNFITSASPFTFDGGYFFVAFNTNRTAYVVGYLAATAIFTDVFAVTPVATYHAFNWSGIDRVQILDVNAGNIAVDDLSFNASVPTVTPEPATLAVLVPGLLAVGAVARRGRYLQRTSKLSVG